MQLLEAEPMLSATVMHLNLMIFDISRYSNAFQKLSTPYRLGILLSPLLSSIIEDVGKVATSAVLTIVHSSHENTCTAL
jgi:hypothetical protein